MHASANGHEAKNFFQVRVSKSEEKKPEEPSESDSCFLLAVHGIGAVRVLDWKM